MKHPDDMEWLEVILGCGGLLVALAIIAWLVAQ